MSLGRSKWAPGGRAHSKVSFTEWQWDCPNGIATATPPGCEAPICRSYELEMWILIFKEKKEEKGKGPVLI